MTLSSCIELEPIPYELALEKQRALHKNGGHGWFLFRARPIITLGRHASQKDVLVSEAELNRAGVQLMKTDRGGQATYHGPSQLLGFPWGTLQDFTGDPRGIRLFLERLQSGLVSFLEAECGYSVDAIVCGDEKRAGIWIIEGQSQKKIVSLGMHFSRNGISHGFALNLWPESQDGVQLGFQAINPCGMVGAVPATFAKEKLEVEALAQFASRLAASLENFGACRNKNCSI